MKNGILGAAVAIAAVLALLFAYTQLQDDAEPVSTPVAVPTVEPRSEPSVQDLWQAGHDEGYDAVITKCLFHSDDYADNPSGRNTSFRAGWEKGVLDAAAELRALGRTSCSE